MEDSIPYVGHSSKVFKEKKKIYINIYIYIYIYIYFFFFFIAVRLPILSKSVSNENEKYISLYNSSHMRQMKTYIHNKYAIENLMATFLGTSHILLKRKKEKKKKTKHKPIKYRGK